MAVAAVPDEPSDPSELGRRLAALVPTMREQSRFALEAWLAAQERGHEGAELTLITERGRVEAELHIRRR